MSKVVEKVTAFITKETESGRLLLLLQHPYAGIQIPAGTVEPTESPDIAVIREVFEETGMTILSRPVLLGCEETRLPPDEAIILSPATVYARPDKNSFDWIKICGSVQVKLLRQLSGWKQISYSEYDQVPDPTYISMQITGWVPEEFLAQTRLRHFFHIEVEGDIEPLWEVRSDHHTFRLFWSSWDDLPSIIPPQDNWLQYLAQYFREMWRGV